MSGTDPSTLVLRNAIAAIEPEPWLRSDIIDALAKASEAMSVASFYHLYFSRLILAFDDPEDAELVEFLSSRMLESEAIVNAHVEEQRDHLRHTVHDFLLGYIILNATSYFRSLSREFASCIGYVGDPMSCLNYAWFLAAHFHDLGYPVEYHHYLLDFTRKVASDFPYVSQVGRGPSVTYRSDAPLTSLFAWRAGLYGVSEGREGAVPTLPQPAVLQQISRPDHALTAAFLLWDRASQRESETPSKQFFNPPVLRTAALACASHNFQYLVPDGGEWFRISLARDPVSFLLQLVDEVQDWSRERIDIDMLWQVGVPKHRYARAVLCEPLRIVMGESGRLDISYAVAVQPFVDDPADPDQLRRAREFLERDLIKRSQSLSKVLKMEKRDIALEGRYFIGSEPWPSDSYQECVVRLALGEPQIRWKSRWQPQIPSPMLNIEPAGAVEVLDRKPGARVLSGPDGEVRCEGCSRGEARIWLDRDGKVVSEGLRPGAIYLLIGAGGIGKSTLLQHVAMNPPSPYSAFYLDVIPSEVRELDFEQISEQPTRLFLVDHFDHVLSQAHAEYWKGEVAQLRVPNNSTLVLACRTEVADGWPYAEIRPDIRVLEAYREGHQAVYPEEFIQQKLGVLRPNLREELANLAFEKKSERWIPLKEVAPSLRGRAIEVKMLREVHGYLRFDHDHVQDALATLGILRAIPRREGNFNLGRELVATSPWVYAFLLWSLCGEKRGISPFLDLGREAYLHLRRETLDCLLRSSRALQWLQHTGASDLGATGEGERRLPIEELDQALAKELQTVQPEHIGLVGETTARSLFNLYFLTAPATEEEAAYRVDLVLRFHSSLGGDADRYFAAQPTAPAKWMLRRRHNVMMTRAYLWARPYREVHRRITFWDNWRDRWEEERRDTENATVNDSVKDYWLAIWMSQRMDVELLALQSHRVGGPADRDEIVRSLKTCIHLAKRGIFHRRRAIEWGTGIADDGYETWAQGLGDQALAHEMVIRRCWEVIDLLREDPLRVVQMTVEFEREIRVLWERARRAVRSQEKLSRFYARCASTVAYAAAIRIFRDNPARPLHEVERGAEKAFNEWLKPYPFEAARDVSFKAVVEFKRIVETIQRLEGVLRNEARRWTGEKGGHNG